MVNVCWQCGDIGFTEALAYCIMCKSAAMHRYCLEEVPEDLAAEINWLCEDCKTRSPNYASKAKFPKTIDVKILAHTSGRAQFVPENICQEIDPSNDHLVNSHDQHPVGNVRIGSSANVDSHVSYDFKKKTLSCATDGAVGTISSYDGLKLKDDGVEVCGNEKSKIKRQMLSDKDKLDSSQPLVNAQDTIVQFTAKRLPDTSVKASDIQIIGGTSNCDIGGLEAGSSSVCFGLKEGETDKSEKEKSKESGLVLPDKNELNKFHPLISGEGTNFSLVKIILGTSAEPSDSQITRTARCSLHKFQAVESSPCYKQKENELQGHVKGKTKSNASILPTSNFNHIMDDHGTSISFPGKKLPDTYIEQSDRHTIGTTLSNATNTLDAVRSSVFCPKEDNIEKYGEKNPNGRYIVPYKDMVDHFHPIIDGRGTDISFSVERLVCTSIEPSDNKISKRTLSCGNNALDAIVSSTCVKFNGGQIEKGMEKPMMGVIVPGMDQLNDIQPPIDGQGSSIKFAAKRLSGTSIKVSHKQAILSTSSCNVGTVGVVNVHSKKKKKRRKPRRRRLIPPVKGERDNFHPVIFCQGNNIPMLAKRVPSTSIGASDGQVIGRIKRSDTVGVIRSSVCFELERGGIDGCRRETSGSRTLPTENELNSWRSVIDRQCTTKFSAERLPGNSVKPFDRHEIKLVETKAETKFPCPSLFVGSHVWRGCFNINKAEFGPLTANLSRRACLKVCNFARKLPLVLHMQKFPRLVAWPNSFKVTSPTADNVALYFFAKSFRAEAVLDDLVDDIINKDLMLRFQFDEVELLVFSSFVLPPEHRMFFGKYYPWGVFKPRSATICSLPAGSHTGYQVDEALKPVRKSEEEDHNVGLFKYSSHEINDFALKQYSIQPKKENVRVTANSTDACEEGRLRTLDRKPSGHVEPLWHREEQLGDCEKKLGIEMEMNYTSELEEVAEEIKRELMG